MDAEQEHPTIEEVVAAAKARSKAITASPEGMRFRSLAHYVAWDTTYSPEEFQAIVRSVLEDLEHGRSARALCHSIQPKGNGNEA